MRGKRLGAIACACVLTGTALADETKTIIGSDSRATTVVDGETVYAVGASAIARSSGYASSGTIVPIGPFAGDHSEGFETPHNRGFNECVRCTGGCNGPDRIFDETGDLCTPGGAGANVTGGWGFDCSLSPHAGTWFYGSASGVSEVSFDDCMEALEFGAYFATNTGRNPNADIEFYDRDDNLIDTLVAEFPSNCQWAWNGWRSDVPIKRIRLIGGDFGGAFVMLDDMEYTAIPAANGACCVPDGSCTDDVSFCECLEIGGRFGAETLCADLDPPCEEQTGRCCIDGENAECAVITGTECGDRGGEFAGFGTDCVGDPCGFAEGACCIFPDCIGTMRFQACVDQGGAWFEGETCPEFECPEVIDCFWDNGIRPDGFSGRAISPPNFPDIRVVDDVEFPEPGCQIGTLRANIIEDAGWTPGDVITVYAYEDNGGAPGALLDSVDTSFIREATGDNYFGRDDFDYTIEGVGLELPGGVSWIGTRNPDGGGAGTNYWMTSDGGEGTDRTGQFSLDAGGTWTDEGAGWNHAFEIVEPPGNGACCLPDGSCTDDVPGNECRDIGGEFSRNTLCDDLDPPCEEQTGRCCLEGGEGCTRDPEWICDGDTDGDGQVNPVDSGLVQANFGSTDEADLCQYDVDCDGQINPVDSGIVQSLFGTCNAPRDSCGGGGGDPSCEVITATECGARGGEFAGFGSDCEGDPCGFAEGACCLELDCADTTREAACDDLGGVWYQGQTCPEFSCPDVVACGWDNGMIPDGFSGRAISPPNFPDIRVVDDIVAENPGCTVLNFHANVIEDAGWTEDGIITVFVYEDSGSGPGALLASVDSEYTRTATGDNYFGRDDFDYWVEGVSIDLPVGTSWIGIRNAGGGGAGTNYWMTSDGGADGPGSDTGWFSLDAGGTFAAEGDGWQHAFEVVP